MTGESFRPRDTDLEALLVILVKEHALMKEGLRRAREAAERRDFESVSLALKELGPVFRQHIADEEAQVLRFLIGQLGVEGADYEIKVFQQHRPIYQLMEGVARLAAMSAAELGSNQAKLDALFEEHTRVEEQHVFPRVASLLKDQGA